MKRITDQELMIRNSVIHALLAALGYLPADGSAANVWEVDRRIKAAVADGTMVHPSLGLYGVSRPYFDLVQKSQKGGRPSLFHSVDSESGNVVDIYAALEGKFEIHVSSGEAVMSTVTDDNLD